MQGPSLPPSPRLLCEVARHVTRGLRRTGALRVLSESLTRILGTFLLAGLLTAASGCGPTGALLAMTLPNTEKVPPEFNRLPEHTVLIHAYALPEIRWAYDKVTLDVAAYLSDYLQQHVKKVNIVDVVRVATYMEKTPDSENDPVGVGKQFGADIVIEVSVYKLSVRDPDMAHFYRGRMSASVVAYDLTRPNEPPERIPLTDVEVVVPEEGPVGLTDTSGAEVRQQTYVAFTTKAGRKFHEYERPIK